MAIGAEELSFPIFWLPLLPCRPLCTNTPQSRCHDVGGRAIGILPAPAFEA